MIQKNYLKPVTLGEYLWISTSSREGINGSMSELKRWLRQSCAPTLKRPFTLPILSETKLESLLSRVFPSETYKKEVIFSENPLDYSESLFAALKPERTLERGSGDCQSLAILSVAFNRQIGIPCRFHDSNPHVQIEEHNGSKWLKRDPQFYHRVTPLDTTNPELDKAYETALVLLT